MRGAGARCGLSCANCRLQAPRLVGLRPRDDCTTATRAGRGRETTGGVGGGARRGDDAGARSEPWAAARLGGAKPTARLTRRADPRTEAGRRRHTPEELPSVLSERPQGSRSQVDERHVAGWGATPQPAAAAASDPAPRAAPATAVAWEAGPAWSPVPPTHVGGRQVQKSWAGKGDQRPIHTHPFTVCRERGAEAS